MSGPLEGYKILEMSAIGPGPFCAMMLSDMGAEVIRVDRLQPGFLGGGGTVVDRGRKSIAIDIKKPGAAEIVLDIMSSCDALIEGYRPGVMERLGLGPDLCLKLNPRIVYGRMTGWGQTGPLATAAGHDLNYIAISGVLHALGQSDRPPPPPLHLLGDIGGGGMMLAFGIVCALLESRRSGKGQVIDAAICDGIATLSSAYHGNLATGKWLNKRQANMLDGGAHFYGCYVCSDGKFISIGAIEPNFYKELLDLCHIQDPDFESQWDRGKWPELRTRLEVMFASKTRGQWCELLEGSDACFAPVLDFEEAPQYPHYIARGTFVHSESMAYPAPSPRFDRTPGQPGVINQPGHHTEEILKGLGKSSHDIFTLRENGVI